MRFDLSEREQIFFSRRDACELNLLAVMLESAYLSPVVE